jgi:hypothetical protein
VALLDFPNPAEWIQSAKNGTLERETANAFLSMLYSAQISFLWRSGSAKWAAWTGEGQALKDAATAMYLSLQSLEKKNFLSLTVPQDLLAADNLSRFITTSKEK